MDEQEWPQMKSECCGKVEQRSTCGDIWLVGCENVICVRARSLYLIFILNHCRALRTDTGVMWKELGFWWQHEQDSFWMFWSLFI